MLKRFRQLRISLAAKCQILFGSSVLIIIGAALCVPWQRMEQLMDQLNQRAAQALAEQAISDHIAAASTPSAGGASVDQRPPWPSASRPSAAASNAALFAPRLIGVNSALLNKSWKFERRAMDQFKNDPDAAFVGSTYLHNGVERYRFALRLNNDSSCIACHADGVTVAPTAPPAESDIVQQKLLGLISVDIESQINANEVFLNRLFILTAGLLACTLAIAIFYLITARLILEPVRVLQETAEKVSEGDLDIRSDINTGDEFQQLSETFNIMLVNLKKGADQLRSINKSLDSKLGQLAQSNVALYESNRLKSEFLANVSHELRTPLNSILGFAELLKDTQGASPEAKSVRYLQNILTSGKNLLELINDLLDLAKIEAGRMEVRSEPLVLGDLFEGLGNVLKPLTEPKRLSIRIAVAPDVPILQTDPAKLQQVLYNLLSNAIKFSPDGAIVDLSARIEQNDAVNISVTDEGPGIDPEKQALIFEKFRQLDGSVTREHSGSGLGLAISKDLTALLGGRIGVVSVPGQGASFWVVLPIKVEAGSRDVRSKLVLT
jgi:two-component system, NarL family, sensor histidine kinase BarA